MVDNPRTLVQFLLRIPLWVRQQLDAIGTKEGVNAQEIARRAVLLYLSMRKSLPEETWYEVAGKLAPMSGKEPGELFAEMVDRAMPHQRKTKSAN